MNDFSYDSCYLSKVFETENAEYAEWFGYYNYDTLSADGKKMLCNRAAFDGRALTAEDTIELGWYDIPDGQWHPIDVTDSFNWQQGAMLQWVPNHTDWVAYNFSDKSHFKSALHNIATGEKKIVDFPIYCLTPDGRYSVSLNYERSYWCRAYHYQPIANEAYNVQVAEDDGIFWVDLQQNTVTRLISIQDIIATDWEKDFSDAKHWLEHIMISPNGKRIVFLHRYTLGDGYRTRLMLANIDGSKLQAIPNWNTFEWSHFGWHGDDAFAIYSVKRSNVMAAYTKTVQANNGIKKTLIRIARKLIKPLLPKKVMAHVHASESYYQYYVYTADRFVLKETFDDPAFSIDGHPTFIGADYMLTDTYPAQDLYQSLLLYNVNNRNCLKLGSFYAPFKDNPASCDLHPKVSRDGQYVVVDTAHAGIHNMVVFRINWDKIKKDMQ